jgi:hypothetical protein
MAERGRNPTRTARPREALATALPTHRGVGLAFENMSTKDTTSLLEEAFANVHRGQDPEAACLDEAIRTYTDEMKAVGWTAEQVIVGVKRAANRSGAMMRRTPRSIMEPSTAAQQIVSQAVTLSIGHYFGGDGKKSS